jgi:AcrR family transcriptional regulator
VVTTAEVREAGGRQRRNRRQEVLEAAIRVFHKKGYASASIQDVAEEVGVLKGSLYHYIDSKEDLLARIFEDSAGHFMEMLDDASGLDERPVERLRSFGRSCSSGTCATSSGWGSTRPSGSTSPANGAKRSCRSAKRTRAGLPG